MTDLVKLDALIAAQLGKSIELNSKLRARIEQLEAALREIAFDDISGASLQHKEIARNALGQSSPPKAST